MLLTPKRFLKRFQCRVYVTLCLVWISLSLLMNYFSADDDTQINIIPTSVSDRLKSELAAFFKANMNNNTYETLNLGQLLDNLTEIPDYPYNQTGCRLIFSNKSNLHKTSLITQTRCTINYTLLILVTSNILHFDRRTLIRHTWGNDRNCNMFKWKVFFLVGRTHDGLHLNKLSCEADMFNDVIFGDTYEHFFNLTFKLQMGFEWSVNYCKFKYLLKADDDVFVNLPKLFAFLYDKETPRSRLYAGNVHYAAKVFRSGKYAVSKKEYWKKIYPRYCSGGGFVLSNDVVKMMTLQFDNVRPLKIDDAYIGELALSCGIDVIHHDYFRMFENEAQCSYNNTFIVHHPVKDRPCMLKLFAQHFSLVKNINDIR